LFHRLRPLEQHLLVAILAPVIEAAQALTDAEFAAYLDDVLEKARRIKWHQNS
jgi:hypothetical protein